MGLIDTRWFQNQLSDRGVSQRRLAKMLGLDPAAVSLMLHGRRKFTAREAVEIARVLGVGVDDVLAHAGLRKGAAVPGKGDGNGNGEGGGAAKGGGVEGAGAAAIETIEIPVPLAGGGVARVVMPRRLKKEDAERIAAVIRAFVTD